MRLLVNLATGPENPTRAALALLVARTAAEAGHEVRVFLAGDAVQLVRPATAQAAQGVGTGNVAEHLDALRAAGAGLALSGMSSQARELDPPEGFAPAPPQKLVESVDWADKVLTY